MYKHNNVSGGNHRGTRLMVDRFVAQVFTSHALNWRYTRVVQLGLFLIVC